MLTQLSDHCEGQSRGSVLLMQISQSLPFSRTWAEAGAPVRLRIRWGMLLRAAAVLLPTILAVIYYGFLATPRYVSEARFVIRAASKAPSLASGLDSILQLAGLSHSQDDAYAVRDFMTSRDAVTQLKAKLDLGGMYRNPDADMLVRYPSLVFHNTDEGFYRYLQTRFSVIVNNSTGLTTLRVEAFRAADAQQVANALLTLGEGLVNKLNKRLEHDAVRVAADEVARAEQARIDAQIAVTAFRNRSLLLDPGATSATVVKVIGELSTQLADARTQIEETQAGAPNSPQLATYRERALAIEHQIATERARVANDSDGLAEKIAEYERLMLKQEFSVRTLAQAVSALELAKVDARRQQMFLERVVEPNRPDQAMMPRRVRMIFTVFGFNVIGAGVVWLLVTGLREHAGAAAKRS